MECIHEGKGNCKTRQDTHKIPEALRSKEVQRNETNEAEPEINMWVKKLLGGSLLRERVHLGSGGGAEGERE